MSQDPTFLTIQIPKGIRMIPSEDLEFKHIHSWCDLVKHNQTVTVFKHKWHRFQLPKKIPGISPLSCGSSKSEFIAVISMDTELKESATFLHKYEISHLCFGFRNSLMWNEEPRGRVHVIKKFIECVKLLQISSELFKTVKLVFENTPSACLFLDFVHEFNLVQEIYLIVSAISILSDSSSLEEQLLAIDFPVSSILPLDAGLNRCSMMCDILSSGKPRDDSVDNTFVLDQFLNSAKLWRQTIRLQNLIILDIKFYTRSEKSLKVMQASVFDCTGSLLRQFSGLPDHLDSKALTEEMNYVDNGGHYSYNGDLVLSQTGLLKALVTYLNFLALQKNIVMCTYSTDAVIAPLLNDLEENGLLKELKSNCIGVFDIVSFTSWKFVGKLIREHGQSYMDKDIIAKIISNQWKKHAERIRSCIQPLYLVSISQNPDILFLNRHTIKQITTSNRIILQVHTQDSKRFQYLLVLPSIDPDWHVASVLKVGTQLIQIKIVLKKPVLETDIPAFGFLMPSSQDQITLGNMRVIAHVFGPDKLHFFRSMELWKKMIPIVETQNIMTPHVLGHKKTRKSVKNLAYSEVVPSACEVLILSLGFSQEGVRHFSISNISKRRRLSLSDQIQKEEYELIKEFGNGLPKIVIGHNVMDMLDAMADTSKVFGIIELEWLLSEDQRQTFDVQPSWGDIVGKQMGFDFQFIPVQSFEIHYFTLLYIKKQLEQYDLTLDFFVETGFRRFMLPHSMSGQLRPRDSNVFLSTLSKDLNNGTTAPSTITLRPLEDLTEGISNNVPPQNPLPVHNASDIGDNRDSSILGEQTSRTCLTVKKNGYLQYNLLILNLKTTTTAATSFVSAIEAYLPTQNKSFHEMILPEGISQEILTANGYSWNGSAWNLERDGSTNQVMVESRCLQKLNVFVETGFGPRQRFVLVVPCVKTFAEFLIMLKRHNRIKKFLPACRGWLDVKCLIYLRVLSPRQYFIKALDLEGGELFQLYEYVDSRALGRVREVPNVLAKILKTFKNLDFYRQALPISLGVKPYNLVFVNVRALKYSVDRQYECLSVIYAKNIVNGDTFHCALEPYGVYDPNLVQELGYKQNPETWILEHEGKTLPCLSLMNGMIKFLRFACAHNDETMKTILVCSVFRESLAHLFAVVEFLKANTIFFNEVVAIFDFATFHFIEKKQKFLVTEAILNHYKSNFQQKASRCSQLRSASDIVGQSEEILECLAMQAQECAIGIQDMIAKNAHGWNSPTWNKLLKDSHILMFQDHVFPLELAATVSMPENSPKLVPCQVAQPVVSFSDKLYTTLPHPMTNIIVHERIEMSPDRPLDLKISCHGNHKELKKGSIIGLICRQDKYQHYMQDLENSLEAVNHERLNVRKSNSRERLQDDNYLISDTMEQKPDIAFLNQSMIESTKKTKKNLPSEENPGKKQCSKKNNYEEVENPKNITVSSTFAPIEKEVEASLSIGAKQNGEDPTSKCVKGKPLSPLSAQEMEEMGIASSSEDHQDLGKVLDTFMATKGEEDKVQTNIERSEDPFSLDELQDKFIALNEHPSFTPLMLAYMKWCSVNKKDVDGCIGDTFIVHLVAMGCTTYDYLKEMFSKVDPWNESQIRISLAEKYTSMETLWSNNGLMDILSWMIWHVFSPINSCNSPLQSEGDLNLNVESESREQPTSTQIVETSQVLVPPRSPECQDFELNGTQSESNTEPSSNPPIIRSSSALPTLLLEKKCSEVEKKKQSPEGSDLQDKMESLKERSSANSVSTFSTSSSENSVTNDTNSIATDEVTETTKADLKKVSMEAEQEGSGLEFSSENEKSDQTSTTSSSNEDWDKGPSKTISDIEKPLLKSSKVGLTTNEESSNDPVTKTLDQLPDEEDYKHLPFDIEKLWKSISYGKITSVSGDIVAITAYPSRIVGTSKNEEKARGKILFQSSEVLDKLIGQTAITFPNEKRERIAVFTSILQKSDQMHWGFIAALDSYKRVVQVGFYYDEALHYTETPYDRVLGSFGHFVVHSCCLVHVNGPVNEAKSLENVVIFVNPTPCLAIVKQLQVRKTSKDLLESFFHEAKFEHINKDKYFCIMSSPLKVLDANDLNRKFVKLLTVDQDPQNVKTHCKTIAPQNPILVFFRPGRLLVLSDQLSDERLVVETIEKMSPSTNTPDEKSNCLVFWHIYPPSSGDVSTNDSSQSLVEFQDGDPQGPNTSAGEPQVNEYVTNNLCSYHSHLKTKLCRNSILRKCPRSDEECYFAHNISAYIKPREYCRYFIQGYCWRGNCPFPHKTVQNLYMAYKAKVKNMIKQCKNCEKVKPNKPKSPTPTRYPTRSSRKRSLPRDSSYEPSSKTQPQMPDFF